MGIYLERLQELVIELVEVGDELSVLEMTPLSYSTTVKARHKMQILKHKIEEFRADLDKKCPRPRAARGSKLKSG